MTSESKMRERMSENKRENERENVWEREREIKETNKKKTTDKSTTFKLHRNPTRSYIKPLDQLLRRKIKSSVNSPSISKTVVIWCKSCLFNRMITLRRLIARLLTFPSSWPNRLIQHLSVEKVICSHYKVSKGKRWVQTTW